MKEKKNGFTRKILFRPAWDKRNSDPPKNYGIHCVDMRFILIKNRRAVHFVLYTGWYLKEGINIEAIPADLGYHSPKPMFEGQPRRKDKCEYIGCRCYCDGSGLNAEEPFMILKREGEEALWKFLEDYFNGLFERKQQQ